MSWNTILRVGTWNVRSLSNSDRSSGGEQAQRDVMSDLGAQQLALVAVQECRWEGTEAAQRMGAYMWYGGGGWKNSNGQPNGGVLADVHRRWSRAVIGTAHRGGRVQFVVSDSCADESYSAQFMHRQKLHLTLRRMLSEVTSRTHSRS